MDPQAPITPIAASEESRAPQIQDPKFQPPKDNHWITILAMAIFVLFSLGVVVFLYYQNQQLKQMLASFQPQETPTPVASASATPGLALPTISSPSANMKVISPLLVTGKVPAGWMNEGVFPIKLVDANQRLVVQGQPKANVPGSWLSGNPVRFTAPLTFKTTAASGFLILENDNPSGDPANAKSFKLPLIFSGTISPGSPTPSSKACTLEAKLCPDGTYVGRTGPNCEFAPCP